MHGLIDDAAAEAASGGLVDIRRGDGRRKKIIFRIRATECIIREEITPQRDTSIGIILVHKAILAEVNQKLASW